MTSIFSQTPSETLVQLLGFGALNMNGLRISPAAVTLFFFLNLCGNLKIISDAMIVCLPSRYSKVVRARLPTHCPMNERGGEVEHCISFLLSLSRLCISSWPARGVRCHLTVSLRRWYLFASTLLWCKPDPWWWWLYISVQIHHDLPFYYSFNFKSWRPRVKVMPRLQRGTPGTPGAPSRNVLHLNFF